MWGWLKPRGVFQVKVLPRGSSYCCDNFRLGYRMIRYLLSMCNICALVILFGELYTFHYIAVILFFSIKWKYSVWKTERPQWNHLPKLSFLSWHIKEELCTVCKSNLNAPINKLIKRKMTLFDGFLRQTTLTMRTITFKVNADFYNSIFDTKKNWKRAMFLVLTPILTTLLTFFTII